MMNSRKSIDPENEEKMSLIERQYSFYGSELTVRQCLFLEFRFYCSEIVTF